ncbi:MAG: leucine-rich repeat-containing protein [Amphiamblys sp. WSBS2006]|nr:MAG: leucine-rich repeat-containing protein [Amphiamblys sp. WSBS2006]
MTEEYIYRRENGYSDLENIDTVSEANDGNVGEIISFSSTDSIERIGISPSGILNLSSKSLQSVPEYVFCDEKIVTLDLTKNELAELPEEISRLRNMERLAVGSNRLKTLPAGLKELPKLRWLDITDNQLEKVPPFISEMARLLGIGLSACRLKTFPDDICNLTGLVKAAFFSNSFKEIPSSIGSLKNLMKLDLSSNIIRRLPEEIGELRRLTWFNLSNNMLEELPSSFANLSELRELGLGNNILQQLPDLSSLKHLRVLSLFNNYLEELGEWIGELKHLTKLDVSNNKLRELPESVFTLPNCTLLSISKNKISSIKAPFCQPKSSVLELFIFYETQIVTLPVSFFLRYRRVVLRGATTYSGEESLEREFHHVPVMKALCWNGVLGREVCEKKKRAPGIYPGMDVVGLPMLLEREREGMYLCDVCEKRFYTPPITEIFYEVSEGDDHEKRIAYCARMCSRKCCSELAGLCSM